jgi:hypothetical protein
MLRGSYRMDRGRNSRDMQERREGEGKGDGGW